MNLPRRLLFMKYLRGCLIVAKFIIFSCGMQTLFETCHQHFYRFASKAFDFIKIIFAKIHLALRCFCEIKIPIKFAINGKYTYHIYLKYNMQNFVSIFDQKLRVRDIH